MGCRSDRRRCRREYALGARTLEDAYIRLTSDFPNDGLDGSLEATAPDPAVRFAVPAGDEALGPRLHVDGALAPRQPPMWLVLARPPCRPSTASASGSASRFFHKHGPAPPLRPCTGVPVINLVHGQARLRRHNWCRAADRRQLALPAHTCRPPLRRRRAWYTGVPHLRGSGRGGVAGRWPAPLHLPIRHLVDDLSPPFLLTWPHRAKTMLGYALRPTPSAIRWSPSDLQSSSSSSSDSPRCATHPADARLAGRLNWWFPFRPHGGDRSRGAHIVGGPGGAHAYAVIGVWPSWQPHWPSGRWAAP